MKTKLVILSFICLMIAGCTSEQERIEYITNKLHTKEIWWYGAVSANFYVARALDGSVWIIERDNTSLVTELTMHQIFPPNK